MTENLFFDMRIRNSIKINWLSVAASMLLVTVIGSVVLVFEFYTDDVYFKTRNFNYFLVQKNIKYSGVVPSYRTMFWKWPVLTQISKKHTFQ